MRSHNEVEMATCNFKNSISKMEVIEFKSGCIYRGIWTWREQWRW